MVIRWFLELSIRAFHLVLDVISKASARASHSLKHLAFLLGRFQIKFGMTMKDWVSLARLKG